MARRSPLLTDALAQWRECRDAYELHLLAQYAAADEACRGVLLNRRGLAAGISSESLFLGRAARAHAYASPELLEFWLHFPRVTFAEFERQWWHG